MTHNSAKSDGHGLTLTANIAGAECHQAGTAGGGIAPQLANRQPTGSGPAVYLLMCDAVGRVSVTSINAKRNVTAKNGSTHCAHCGAKFMAKRPDIARYCSSRCRRAAWLLANPEKAAALADGDKQRLRAHLEERGIAWQERERL